MANSKPKVNTYKRTVDGETETLGAYEGSPLDEVLADDDDWKPDNTPAQAVAPKTDKVGQGADYSKLSVEELRQIAAQRGIEDAESLNKRDALKAITAAEKAAAEQPPA